MRDDTQTRRTELIEGIKRHRQVLQALNFAQQRDKPEAKEERASQIEKFTQELRVLEAELHGLNVAQIRKELSGE